MSTKRAVVRPQRGHSTTRLGFDTSTYRVCFEAATVDFGFYPVTEVARRARFRSSKDRGGGGRREIRCRGGPDARRDRAPERAHRLCVSEERKSQRRRWAASAPQLRRPLPTRSYTDRRGSTRPRDFRDDRPWRRRSGTQLLRRGPGPLPHLPAPRFAERAGHLPHPTPPLQPAPDLLLLPPN